MKPFAPSLMALLFAGALSSPLQALETSFGLQAGGGAANWQGPAAALHGDRTAVVGGLVVEAGFTRRWAAQVGLGYGQAGQLVQPYQGATALYDLSYLQIPVLLKLYADPMELGGRFFLEGGLETDLLMQKTVTVMASPVNASADIVGLLPMDFRTVLGLGTQFGTHHSLDVDVRWTYSLSTIIDPGALNLPAGATTPDARNSWVGAILTYRYHL